MAKGGRGGAVRNAIDSIWSSVYDWEQSITESEKESVIKYTDANYIFLNTGLRDGDWLGMQADEAKYEIANMDNAINKFVLDKSITVYRGLTANFLGADIADASDAELFKGMEIHDRAYVSTSTNKSIAEGFASSMVSDGGRYSAPIICKITVPKGKGRGAYVESITAAKTEDEFIMPRGTVLRIKSAHNEYIDGVKHVVISMDAKKAVR